MINENGLTFYLLKKEINPQQVKQVLEVKSALDSSAKTEKDV